MTRLSLVVASGLLVLLGACGGSIGPSAAYVAENAPYDAGTVCDPTVQHHGCEAGTVCDLSAACVTPSYAMNGDGTVTDSVTGLVWQQPVPSDPCPVDDGYYYSGLCTWADAQAYCANLSLGGQSGWRLPELTELYSLVDLGAGPPAIDGTAFPQTPGAFFWTSSPGLYTDNVWVVDFFDGTASGFYVGNVRAVRCVR